MPAFPEKQQEVLEFGSASDEDTHLTTTNFVIASSALEALLAARNIDFDALQKLAPLDGETPGVSTSLPQPPPDVQDPPRLS